jgi:hypothetical protein
MCCGCGAFAAPARAVRVRFSVTSDVDLATFRRELRVRWSGWVAAALGVRATQVSIGAQLLTAAAAAAAVGVAEVGRGRRLAVAPTVLTTELAAVDEVEAAALRAALGGASAAVVGAWTGGVLNVLSAPQLLEQPSPPPRRPPPRPPPHPSPPPDGAGAGAAGQRVAVGAPTGAPPLLRPSAVVGVSLAAALVGLALVGGGLVGAYRRLRAPPRVAIRAPVAAAADADAAVVARFLALSPGAQLELVARLRAAAELERGGGAAGEEARGAKARARASASASRRAGEPADADGGGGGDDDDGRRRTAAPSDESHSQAPSDESHSQGSSASVRSLVASERRGRGATLGSVA